MCFFLSQRNKMNWNSVFWPKSTEFSPRTTPAIWQWNKIYGIGNFMVAFKNCKSCFFSFMIRPQRLLGAHPCKWIILAPWPLFLIWRFCGLILFLAFKNYNEAYPVNLLETRKKLKTFLPAPSTLYPLLVSFILFGRDHYFNSGERNPMIKYSFLVWKLVNIFPPICQLFAWPYWPFTIDDSTTNPQTIPTAFPVLSPLQTGNKMANWNYRKNLPSKSFLILPLLRPPPMTQNQGF